jgi:protein-S-isoprenylcysteine O-methyltransferase Ste14
MYTAMGLTDQTVVRTPGQIDGQQFIIDNCKDCVIRIFDHCAQVTIDDCVGCEVIVGPCADAVFARDCRDCTFHAVCQQWRTRDCTDCRLSLWCPNEPVIEGCSGMEIGPWYIAYPRLCTQFSSAELDPIRSNRCLDVYNFTPPSPGGDAHWRPADEHEQWTIELDSGSFGSPETPLRDTASASVPAATVTTAATTGGAGSAPPKKAGFTPADGVPIAHAARKSRSQRSAGSTAALAVACAAMLLGGNLALDTLASFLFPSLFATRESAVAHGHDGDLEGAEGALPVALPLAISGMVFVATLLGMLVSDVPAMCSLRWPIRLLCAVPCAGAYIWVAASCNTLMEAHETYALHTLPTSSLLTTGPYEFSRHPLYCGTSIALLGAAVILNSRWLLGMLFPWLIYLDLAVVAAEETYLSSAFGAAHATYAADVPRWIPWPCAHIVLLALALFDLQLLGLHISALSRQKQPHARTEGAAASGTSANAKSDVCAVM